MRILISLVVATVVAYGFSVPAAQACGGFFCNRTAPVSQAGEHILFARGDDGTMTAHVRIMYEGGATDFAWILPVPSVPELGVSTESLFTAIDLVTQPVFEMTYRMEGTCRGAPDCDYPWESLENGGGYYDASAPSGDGSVEPPPSVEVAFRGNVGPYDAAVIRSTDGVDALLTWLRDNSYDIPDETSPILAEYVAEDNYFVALRLQKDRGAGEIQPISLSFTEAQPCIPIKLTRIATIPDMPITAYILGSAPAAPQNFGRITPLYEDAGLWTGSTSYSSYISRQVDDAGGRAFVTEYAGVTPDITFIELPSVMDLSESTLSIPSLMRELRSRGHANDPQMLGIFLRFIPLPSDWAGDPADFYNQVFVGIHDEYIATLELELPEILSAIDEAITIPRRDAVRLVGAHAMATRLFTTMSADEMTEDPVFDLEPEAPEVSNIHRATTVEECSSAYIAGYAPRSIEFRSGRRESIRSGERLTDAEYCSNRGGTLAGSSEGSGSGSGPTGSGGGICSMAGHPTDGGALPWGMVLLALSCLGWRRRA